MTELYDALEDCLDAMARGASIDHALRRYPRLASELRPLLEASVIARDAARIHVPGDVRRRGRSVLLEQVQAGREPRKRRRMIPLFPRLALTAGLVAALVLTSTGLVGASSTSLPGQQLYAVKRTWESVRLLFAFSPQQRDLIESNYEQERLDEISELLGQRISAPIAFSGLLSKRVDGQWTISGIPVAVGGGTVLPTTPINDGAPVTVTGITRPEGVVEAQQIQLLQPGASLPPLEPSEVNEHGDSELPEGSGQLPVPTISPTLPVTGTPAVPSGSVPNRTTYRFSGVVQSMQGNVWTINGQPVYVDAAQIDGQVTVGSIVRFEGYYSTDGRLVVTTMEPQVGSSSGGSGEKQGGSDGPGEGGGSEGGDGGN